MKESLTSCRVPFLRLVAVVAGLAIAAVGCGGSTTSPDTKHVAGANCAGCHTQEHANWALTLHAADPAAVLLNAEHDTAELLTDECLTCHAPFQAGQFHIGDFVLPLDQTGPWHLVTANQDRWQAIKCEVCHNPSSRMPNKLGFYDCTTQNYLDVSSTTDLCEKCHQPGTDDSRDLQGSVHEGVQCSACHLRVGNHMSLDPHLSCAQCHPRVDPSHPDVTTLDTTYRSAQSPNNIHFVTCKTCHPSRVTTAAGE